MYDICIHTRDDVYNPLIIYNLVIRSKYFCSMRICYTSKLAFTQVARWFYHLKPEVSRGILNFVIITVSRVERWSWKRPWYEMACFAAQTKLIQNLIVSFSSPSSVRGRTNVVLAVEKKKKGKAKKWSRYRRGQKFNF